METKAQNSSTKATSKQKGARDGGSGAPKGPKLTEDQIREVRILRQKDF